MTAFDDAMDGIPEQAPATPPDAGVLGHAVRRVVRQWTSRGQFGRWLVDADYENFVDALGRIVAAAVAEAETRAREAAWAACAARIATALEKKRGIGSPAFSRGYEAAITTALEVARAEGATDAGRGGAS